MQIEQLGPYRIGRKIGKGGMGSVYEAIEEKTGQRVAVKALSPQLAMAEGFRERFEGEIESLKKLQHEGIVRLLGYGEHDGVLFYSMELVDGPSLEQEINGGRRFDWNETLSLAVQVCRALKHAHDHGVVHRDIKPANLLLAPDGRVKIADFGIARLFGSTQLTTAGGVLGTADYMSPEQADGRAVTEKCDQYSLGCVIYALLAGRPPFRAKTMPEMLQLQRFAQPEPVRRYAPDAPEVLDRLVGQLLSKEPAKRFPNVLVLGRHMEAMQRALSRPARPESAAQASPSGSDQNPSDMTSVYSADATLSPEDLSLMPLETTDSGLYTAPTLADEGQLSLQQPSRPETPPHALTSGEARAATLPRPSRFITVDEEAARRLHEDQSQRWAVATQLLGLAAVILGMVWLGWRLTRPATADDLFAVIESHIAEQGDDDLGPVHAEITDFLEQFGDDPRADDVRLYAEELELQKRARQIRFRSRLTGQTDAHPVAEIFSEAMRIQDADPARAAAMLENLIALYPTEGPAAVGLSEQSRTDLTLARRELVKLHAAVKERSADQLPVLKDRLLAASRLESSSPEQAAAMYRALIDLYGDQPWAGDVIDQARQGLEALGVE